MCIAAVAALVATGCLSGPRSARPPADADRPGAVVIFEGSAFDGAAARDAATRLIGQMAERPVRALLEEPPIERVTRAASSRLERTAPSAARDGACRKRGRSVATAVAERAEIVFRVKLDARTTARPATDKDRADLGPKGFDKVLSVVGLGGGDTVYETTLGGSVERVTFPGTTTTARRAVHWVDRRIGKSGDAPPPSVEGALRDAFDALPASGAARWEPVARGLVSGGCPSLGVAVADTFLDDAAVRRRIHAAAEAFLRADAKRGETTVAQGDAVASNEPEPAPAAEPPADVTSAPEAGYSCTTLCSLHMVELCNNDRTLWTQHGSRWENTRCGTRRSEAFLTDCYRMQWLSGTYERACMRPCEENDEGRSRLIALLRRSGCLKTGT
jgi:hypothetical protein